MQHVRQQALFSADFRKKRLFSVYVPQPTDNATLKKRRFPEAMLKNRQNHVPRNKTLCDTMHLRHDLRYRIIPRSCPFSSSLLIRLSCVIERCCRRSRRNTSRLPASEPRYGTSFLFFQNRSHVCRKGGYLKKTFFSCRPNLQKASSSGTSSRDTETVRFLRAASLAEVFPLSRQGAHGDFRRGDVFQSLLPAALNPLATTISAVPTSANTAIHIVA